MPLSLAALACLNWMIGRYPRRWRRLVHSIQFLRRRRCGRDPARVLDDIDGAPPPGELALRCARERGQVADDHRIEPVVGKSRKGRLFSTSKIPLPG